MRIELDCLLSDSVSRNRLEPLKAKIMAKPDVRKRLGQAIRQFRLAAGLSPKEFGDDIGKDQFYVLQLEEGNVDADILTIDKCAKALGVEIEELFWDEEQRNVLMLVEETGGDGDSRHS